VPDTVTIYPGWSIAPRILSIPSSGTMPIVTIEVIYLRKIDE
jgi:hypothetical protein